MIGDGCITVNGKAVRPSFKLQQGDEVHITIPPPAASPLLPEDIPLKIIYEDQDLLVVDKPPGMTVHPAAGHYDHTLVNAVLAYVPDMESGQANRPGIVHRLDKDTSGLIIIAKNIAAHMNLADQFKNRTVNKVYLAMVYGHMKPDTGIIEACIGRDPRHRKRMAVTLAGRESRTEYRVIRYIGNYSLLEVKPRTGRTHQIRVHLASIGFTVMGDSTYGSKSEYLPRQFLHACKLGFMLPSTGEYLELESDLPPDLTYALQKVAENGKK